MLLSDPSKLTGMFLSKPAPVNWLPKVNLFKSTDLKLRASYGVLGNQEIGDYQYLGLITSGISYGVGEPNTLWSGNIQTNSP